MALTPISRYNNKIRVLIAGVSSIMVLISSVYNLTAAFAIRDIIIDVHDNDDDGFLEERGYLKAMVSNLNSTDDGFQPKEDCVDSSNNLSPCKERVVVKKLYHTAAERKYDKRDVKENEVQSWNDIEQALAVTMNTKPHDMDSNETASKTATKQSQFKHQQRKSKNKATERRTKRNALSSDTTIIITTNWMPSVPSTAQLDKVISSLIFLDGLPNDAPMIIAVDGAYETGQRYESLRNVDMRLYTKAIRAKYNKEHVQVIASSKRIRLVQNMKRALRRVHTKYVLVLQHDLPFINQVNYTALIETMETHSNLVRLVRFPTARVLTRNRDGGVCQEAQVDFEAPNTGIKLTKTHVWSDRNHLTQKSYYNEMFRLSGWNGAKTMEDHMQHYGTNNCSYWGSYLYGARGSLPTIFHMDGRRDGQYRTSTKRIYGNLTGLL